MLRWTLSRIFLERCTARSMLLRSTVFIENRLAVDYLLFMVIQRAMLQTGSKISKNNVIQLKSKIKQLTNNNKFRRILIIITQYVMSRCQMKYRYWKVHYSKKRKKRKRSNCIPFTMLTFSASSCSSLFHSLPQRGQLEQCERAKKEGRKKKKKKKKKKTKS